MKPRQALSHLPAHQLLLLASTPLALRMERRDPIRSILLQAGQRWLCLRHQARWYIHNPWMTSRWRARTRSELYKHAHKHTHTLGVVMRGDALDSHA